MNQSIVIQDLHFTYPGTTLEIFSGLNLCFDQRSTAIIGQNGGGKTTLVKLIKGLLQPSQGQIEVLGYTTKSTTVAELSKYVGLVFQNPNDQIFKNTVLEEVMFGPQNLGMTLEAARKVSQQSLRRVGLNASVDNLNCYDLSLSDRKLVTIASILAMDPKVIIFDEPTIAQDIVGKNRIGEIILELRKAGKLVITIAHDMDFVASYFERIIVLKDRELLWDGSPAEVFAQTEVLRAAKLDIPHIAQLSLAVDRKIFVKNEDYITYCRQLK